MNMYKILSVLVASSVLCIAAVGQLPVCNNNSIVYYKSYATSTSNTAIYNFSIAQPVVTGVNPVLNTIAPPQFSQGLTVSTNLNTTTPSTTFYTVVNGQYYYYSGSAWVNTGHNAGTMNAVNPGAGGGYIFNVDAIGGTVWRYNGTGHAVQILTLPPLNKVADIAVVCTGEFYIMSNGTVPKALNKYDANGSLVKTFSVNNCPSSTGGGGLAVFGDTIYFDDGTNIVKGVITGNTVNCTVIGTASDPRAEDYATCSANPFAAYAGIDTGYYCGKGPGVLVKASGTTPYTWKIINGSANILGTGDSVRIQTFSDSRFVLTSGSSNPACGGNTDTFLVLHAAASVSAGPDHIAYECNGIIKPDTLNGLLSGGSNGVVYNIQWSPLSSILSGDKTLSPVVNPAGSSLYVLAVTTSVAQGNCSWSDTVKVTKTEAGINANFSFQTALGCKADTLKVTNTTSGNLLGVHYTWDWDDDGLVDTLLSLKHIYKKQGSHRVFLYADNGHCADTAVADVHLSHPLLADFRFDSSLVCIGDTIMLSAAPSVISLKPVMSPYKWFVSNITDTTPVFQYVVGNGENRISLVVTDSLRCTDTVTRLLDNILPYPTVDIGPADTAVCDGAEITLPMGVVTNTEELTWQDGTMDASYSVSKPGVYIALAKNKCGIATDTIRIEYKNCTVFFPGAFTPNGDGLNDRARLVGNLLGITECEISIFNRFGERVFHTKNKEEGWDGIYLGTPQLLGTYYYYITYLFLGERYDMKGDITLIR